MFMRAHTDQDGTRPIGLAVLRAWVEAHGGAHSGSSRPGDGGPARVRFTLPR